MNREHVNMEDVYLAELEAIRRCTGIEELRQRLHKAESILIKDEEKWNQYISAVNTPSH